MTTAQLILKQILEATPPRLTSWMTDIITNDERIRPGQFYELDGDIYILAQTSAKHCALISIVGGNRWNEGIDVENTGNITQDEFTRIMGSTRHNFTRLRSIV